MAVLFDNTNDFINCQSATPLDDMDLSGTGISGSAWIRPDGTGEGGLGRIFGKDNSASSGSWQFRVDNATDVRALRFMKDFATTDLNALTTTILTLGVWQHVLFTWAGTGTGTDVNIYVNNVEAVYKARSDGTGAKNSDAALNFLIGNNPTAAATFSGGITEVCVYNKVLSLEERTELYGGGTGMLVKYLPMSMERTSLKGYWPMDETANGVILAATSSTVLDYSGFKNHGGQSGNPVGLNDPLMYETQMFSSTIYHGTIY